MKAKPVFPSYTFQVQLNDNVVTTIADTAKGEMMLRVWKKFNAYAKSKKFTQQITDSQYPGGMAWGNDAGDVISLAMPW